MKIRLGFVSNSSSSSFCIYGVELSSYIGELLEKFEIDEENSYELADVIQEKTGLEVSNGPNGDYLYVGKSWSDIGGDETGKEFKARVEKIIKDVLGVDEQCSTYSEAWYDG